MPNSLEEQDSLKLLAIKPTTKNTIARNIGPKPN
jgi:hypothetical protein